MTSIFVAAFSVVVMIKRTLQNLITENKNVVSIQFLKRFIVGIMSTTAFPA